MKIDFNNRTDRVNKRCKYGYPDSVHGDFMLFIDELGLDNSTGDYNFLPFAFIEGNGQREEFKKFLLKTENEGDENES